VGCKIVAASSLTHGLTDFSEAEAETLAKMEQARWQSERLLAGWKYGTSIRPEVRVIVALRDGENFETWLSVPAALRLGLARAAVTHFFSFACVLGIATAALSADNKPFTPPADLKGKWDFRADPKLPNVLIIGDSISMGRRMSTGPCAARRRSIAAIPG